MLRALDLVTIAVPPSLPAVLSSVVLFAMRRLNKKQIYCISPSRISICGRIKTVVFDKTGTLTEEKLRVKNHFPSEELCENPEVSNQIMMQCMSICHSVAMLTNGRLVGDPLDIEMFQYV